MHRSPEADFVVEGHRYGVFSHDWRVESASEWMALKADRYSLNDIDLEAMQSARKVQPLVVISEAEFGDAVRRALRDYTRSDLLRENPLLRSRLIGGTSGEKGNGEPVAALQSLLRDAVEMLQGNPKDRKLYRALWHTYFEPAATHEQAAELLDLPFSTYRYHLAAGVDRVVSHLWQLEAHGYNR